MSKQILNENQIELIIEIKQKFNEKNITKIKNKQKKTIENFN